MCQLFKCHFDIIVFFSRFVAGLVGFSFPFLFLLLANFLPPLNVCIAPRAGFRWTIRSIYELVFFNASYRYTNLLFPILSNYIFVLNISALGWRIWVFSTWKPNSVPQNYPNSWSPNIWIRGFRPLCLSVNSRCFLFFPGHKHQLKIKVNQMNSRSWHV